MKGFCKICFCGLIDYLTEWRRCDTVLKIRKYLNHWQFEKYQEWVAVNYKKSRHEVTNFTKSHQAFREGSRQVSVRRDLNFVQNG